jgi:hypothetical protein
MSERGETLPCGPGCLALTLVVLLVWLAIVFGWDQVIERDNYIRDLRRRVGQLEQERR